MESMCIGSDSKGTPLLLFSHPPLNFPIWNKGMEGIGFYGLFHA
jgi:hypothetical protein